MNITINKGGKNYEFKYTRENTGISRSNNDATPLVFHKWKCDELSTANEDCEVFFGDYGASVEAIENIKKTAETAINKLPQIVQIEDTTTIADVTPAPTPEVIPVEDPKTEPVVETTPEVTPVEPTTPSTDEHILN